MKSEQIISESLKNRSALALTSDNQVLIDQITWKGILKSTDNGQKIEITGANRSPQKDEIVIFNRFYGEQVPKIKPGLNEMVVVNNKITSITNGTTDKADQGTLIPEQAFIIQAHGNAAQQLTEFREGGNVELKDHFNNKHWNNKDIVNAIGGGPTILQEGQVHVTGQKEGFDSSIRLGRAPRSAVGVTDDNRLIFVTVDGRQPNLSVGITLSELASFMKEYGVRDALNLDGGGSARMVVRGHTMSNPSEKRLISNGILIYDK
jgi:hypothetical protein